MRRLLRILFTLMLCAIFGPFSISLSYTWAASDISPSLRKKQLAPITAIVKKEIRLGKVPGAVVIIGNQKKVLYRRAFGYRAVKPKKIPMTLNTVFDLASLTKVVATTTAVMQLAEKGKLDMEDQVVKYWPEFKENGKEQITVRELLTHYSGLRPDLPLNTEWSGYDDALKMIVSEKPVFTPGTHFVYSDINFIVLGEIVRRVSGKPLDIYCTEHIFKPLGMKDTFFAPPPAKRKCIAPTQYQNGKSGKLLWGEVHDPTCHRMGGVAGHAGLFSTADDMSVFARMLLNEGSFKDVLILSSQSVAKMTSPQSPPDRMPLRGFGWEIGSLSSSDNGTPLSSDSYGHLGYTGTSLWIDPVTKTYVIILTSRVHPYGKGDVKTLRTQVKEIVSAAIEKISTTKGTESGKSKAGCTDKRRSHRNIRVKTGIDVLKEEKFASLAGLRIGLITNHSGLSSAGLRTVDLLRKAPNVKLTAIFSPEHGFYGKEESELNGSFREAKTGIPVYSLYGETRRPSDRMMKGLDALVFDIQDAGVRFYTYITTMGYAMEAAAKKGLKFYVLDRPNPITGSIVQGPVSDRDLQSFVNYFPLPVRHGMTVGELAEMFNKEKKIGAALHVIRMSCYKRTDWFDETGLKWVNPSPNIRSLTEIALYPGIAMVEGANVSVGRGTKTPFELLGAPWINEKELLIFLNSRKIRGVRFAAVDFIPAGDRFKNKLCHGIRIILVDREKLDPSALGMEILSALYILFPDDFRIDKTLDLVGARWILQAIKERQDPDSIVQHWQNELEQFHTLRSKYMLY